MVTYTGTGAAATIGHGLGKAPSMIITKQRNGTWNWMSYHSALGATKYLYLNATDAQATDAQTYASAPTSTVWSVGTNAQINGNTSTYVSYVFAEVAGFSKFGSYTGNGSSQTINCGFSAGARFVLIKRTDSTGDWYVWDSARGISSSNDPYFLLNSAAAEVTTTNYVDTDTTGFKVTAAAPAALNASGGSYIFLAIA